MKRGDVIFEGAIGNKKLKFRSPVNGVVKAINSNPSIEKFLDPYDDWNVELSSKDFTCGKELYFSGSEALNWLKQEFIKLDGFLMKHFAGPELAGVTMYDGGKIVEGASVK